MSHHPNNIHQDGMVALLLVLLVTVVGGLMALNISQLSMGDLESSYTYTQGVSTLALADGCLEETLRRIQLDNTYASGGATINVGTDSCTVTATGSSSAKTIVVVATTASTYTKKISIDITINGNAITIIDWSELSS